MRALPEGVGAVISLCRSAPCCARRSGRGRVVHSPRFSLAKPARLCDIAAYKLYWSMCRLTATRVVVMCAACAAYERLAALFGVSKLGWSVCRLTATRVVGWVRRLRGL